MDEIIRWQIKANGNFEDAVKMAKQQGLSNYDEDGIMFGDSEPAEKPAIE